MGSKKKADCTAWPTVLNKFIVNCGSTRHYVRRRLCESGADVDGVGRSRVCAVPAYLTTTESRDVVAGRITKALSVS